jgi:WD40 repeat protein
MNGEIGRLVRVLSADHQGDVEAVSWSPDGRWLATGSDDGKVRIWDTLTGQERRRFEGHTGIVWSLSWSPDGRRLASGSDDTTVRICDTETGQERCRLEGHTNAVMSMSWSPAGHWLVTGSFDKTIRIWDAQTGQEWRRLEGVTSFVWSVSWSPDGRWLASGSEDRTVRIWDGETGQERSRLEGHTDSVGSLSWSPDGRWLASGSSDNTVRIWDAESGQERRRLDGHTASVWSVSWSPDGRWLASGSYDDAVRIWDAETGQARCLLEGHTSSVRSVSWSSDGRWVASGSYDNTIRIWDVMDLALEARRPIAGDDALAAYVARQAATVGRRAVDAVAPPWVPHLPEAEGDCLGVLRGTGAGSSGAHQVSLALLLGGRRMASGSPDGLVRVWDLATGSPLWQAGPGHRVLVSDVAGSPDGRWLASGSDDKMVRIWDAETGQEQRQLEGHSGLVGSVSWSPDGRWLASGSDDKTVRIWDAESGLELRKLDGHTNFVNSVSWSPNGRWLALGSHDNTARICDGETGQEQRRLEGHSSWVWSVSWSPDGRWLVSGSADKTIRIWDAETGQEQRRLEGHTAGVYVVSCSPDGRWLASGARDKTVRIWHAETGREVSRLTFEEEYAWRMAWSPHGAFLAFSHQGDVFRFWDTRQFAVSRPVPISMSTPTRELAVLPAALTALHGMGLSPPLSLVCDLLRLTAGLPVEGAAEALAGLPGLRKLAALRWPTASRVGLVAWLLRRKPMQGWEPPTDLGPAELRDQLAAAMAGEAINPRPPEPPLVPLQQAIAGVDDRLLTLLAMLGPRAVAANPALILRLARKLPSLPALAESQRRLLGLRLDLDGGGYAQGQGPGTERAGVQRRGDLRSLVPSQLALPEGVLQARQARGELLYRAKAGREPPRLRAAVLLLDVSPASFGPVEAATRLAAYVLASTLVQARLPVWLVTAGGGGTAALLEQPADLVEIWTRRTLEPARPGRALAAARALRTNLVGQSTLEPVIVLLAQAHFGAEEEASMPSESVQGLRGLFVHHPGQKGSPAWSAHCERWLAVSVGTESDLVAVLGELLV